MILDFGHKMHTYLRYAKTPMHVEIKLVSDMLFSGSSCQSRKEMRSALSLFTPGYFAGHAW